MAETIEAVAELSEDGKTIAITPAEGLLDNSVYEIVLSGVKSLDGSKILPDFTAKIMTPLSPMYCTVESIGALVDSFGIPEQNLRIYIRDASKYADYILSQSGNVTAAEKKKREFAMEQFVRTKVTLDCMQRACMDRVSSGAGSTFRLDAVEITESMNSTVWKSMMADLRKDLQKWQDAIRGYFNEGRAKPKATRVGIKASENSDVPHTTVDKILNDFSRSMPDWSE